MTPEQIKGLLELTPTDVLYEELLNRYEHVIFSGLKNRPARENEGQQITSWRYKGNPFICQGLAFGILHECQQARNDTEEEIASDDL
jgi:hypothetical protein